MSSGNPWFVDAFRAEYLQVYAHRDLESARNEVDYLIAHGVRGRVLDLCCGFGRHTLALRERGIDAFGVDLSHDLLVHARTLPRAELLRGRLARADVRRVPFTDRSLDAVAMLFSSFGYFDDGGNRAVIAEIARIARPGARVVLDLMNPSQVRTELVARSEREVRGALLEERRHIDEHTRRVVKDVRLIVPGGRERAWRESVRIYDESEIRDLLLAHGLTLRAVHGDFDATPFASSSPRMIVHAVRPDD
jgi:SAM-dependent methyltransferase